MPLGPNSILDMLSSGVPNAESVGGNAGASMQVPRADHQHPRLTSSTVQTITAGSTATVMFTRTFNKQPGMVFTLLEADAPSQQPVLFSVSDWKAPNGDSLGLDPVAGTIIGGCTVKAWRSTPIPQNLATLLLSAVYSLFGGSVVGVRFTCIAVAASA